MGKGGLAGMRRRTSPDKPRCRSAMMRAAERPPSCKNCRNIFAHHRMDKRRFQTLFLAKAGQDAAKPLRKSHENPDIQALYEEFLGEPCGPLSHELLHTRYYDRKPVVEPKK